MRITSGGNVGIGVDNPSYKLQVNGNIASTNLTGSGLFSISGTRSIAVQSFSGDWNYLRSNGANLVFGTQDSANLYIRTNDTDRMIVTTAGNVGIGTSNPAAKLEVNGNVKATSFTGSFSGSVSAPGSTTQIVYNNGGALAADSGLVYSGSNVGIGTTTPGAKLDIHSASNVITQFNRTGAGKSWIQFQQAGTARWNTGYDNTNGNYTIYDAVNAADRMVVTNAGNVGIGTITPAEKLVVTNGSILTQGIGGGGAFNILQPITPNTDARTWAIGDHKRDSKGTNCDSKDRQRNNLNTVPSQHPCG